MLNLSYAVTTTGGVEISPYMTKKEAHNEARYLAESTHKGKEILVVKQTAQGKEPISLYWYCLPACPGPAVQRIDYKHYPESKQDLMQRLNG